MIQGPPSSRLPRPSIGSTTRSPVPSPRRSRRSRRYGRGPPPVRSGRTSPAPRAAAPSTGSLRTVHSAYAEAESGQPQHLPQRRRRSFTLAAISSAIAGDDGPRSPRWQRSDETGRTRRPYCASCPSMTSSSHYPAPAGRQERADQSFPTTSCRIGARAVLKTRFPSVRAPPGGHDRVATGLNLPRRRRWAVSGFKRP
jgi:hypothetical protein